MAPVATAKKSRSGSETRQRDRLLNIRLSAEEDARIREASAKTGLPMATLLRRALLKEIDSVA